MVSSPEAGSGSSSEDEFNLNASSSTTEASRASKPVDNSKLFSDDEDDDDEETPKAQDDGYADDRDKEKEMEDLFGSDYDSEEEEFKASGIKESPVPEEQRGATEGYAEDIRESSGHSNELWLPKMPRAPSTASYYMCKMPNILRLVPEAYTKQSIEEEMQNPSDETLYRNYVRWRYV